MENRHLYRGKRTLTDNIWVQWDGFSGVQPNTVIEEETICQCTGLKDKNGKLIWENDIANCMDAECCGYISWNESEAGFYFDVLLEDGRFEEEHIYDYQDCMEVIGNNFDNPELLEV